MYIHAYRHKCMHTHVHTCTHTYVYVHTHARICVIGPDSESRYVKLGICIPRFILARLVGIKVHIRTYKHTHMYVYVYTHTYSYLCYRRWLRINCTYKGPILKCVFTRMCIYVYMLRSSKYANGHTRCAQATASSTYKCKNQGKESYLRHTYIRYVDMQI